MQGAHGGPRAPGTGPPPIASGMGTAVVSGMPDQLGNRQGAPAAPRRPLPLRFFSPLPPPHPTTTGHRLPRRQLPGRSSDESCSGWGAAAVDTSCMHMTELAAELPHCCLLKDDVVVELTSRPSSDVMLLGRCAAYCCGQQ